MTVQPPRRPTIDAGAGGFEEDDADERLRSLGERIEELRGRVGDLDPRRRSQAAAAGGDPSEPTVAIPSSAWRLANQGQGATPRPAPNFEPVPDAPAPAPQGEEPPADTELPDEIPTAQKLMLGTPTPPSQPAPPRPEVAATAEAADDGGGETDEALAEPKAKVAFLDAGPFAGLSHLRSFQEAINRLPAVEAARVRRFKGRRAQIEMRMLAPVPVPRELQRLSTRLDVRARDFRNYRVEIPAAEVVGAGNEEEGE